MRGIRRSRDWAGSGRCCDLKNEGGRRVRFQRRIEQSIIVVFSERFRENYAGTSAVAIKQAFTALQGGHRNFLDCF